MTLRLRSKGAVWTGVVSVPEGFSGKPVSESTRWTRSTGETRMALGMRADVE